MGTDNALDGATQGYSEKNYVMILKKLGNSLLPTKKDNFKQMGIKLLFLASLVLIVTTAIWIAVFFADADKQEKLVLQSRDIWYNTSLEEAERFEMMKAKNPDFKGWLKAAGAMVDMPVYQANNDKYYLRHNQNRELNAHGALFLSSKDILKSGSEDKNLVIYGHNMEDGTMFGNLGRYRDISVYRENPVIHLSTVYGDEAYKIYAVFLCCGDAAGDNGYLYDISKSKFANKYEFEKWVEQARNRSIINTEVDLQYGDSFLTLVTRTDDFDNARFVVMARRVREGEEESVDTYSATINPAPVYPKRWYDENGLKYPKGE